MPQCVKDFAAVRWMSELAASVGALSPRASSKRRSSQAEGGWRDGERGWGVRGPPRRGCALGHSCPGGADYPSDANAFFASSSLGSSLSASW